MLPAESERLRSWLSRLCLWLMTDTLSDGVVGVEGVAVVAPVSVAVVAPARVLVGVAGAE